MVYPPCSEGGLVDLGWIMRYQWVSCDVNSCNLTRIQSVVKWYIVPKSHWAGSCIALDMFMCWNFLSIDKWFSCIVLEDSDSDSHHWNGQTLELQPFCLGDQPCHDFPLLYSFIVECCNIPHFKGMPNGALKKRHSQFIHPLGSPFGTPKGRCWVVMFCHCRDDEFTAVQWTLCWSRSLKASTTATGVEAQGFGLWLGSAFEVLANKKRWFSDGFHDGKGSGDVVCHSSVTRKHPKPKSVRNHRQACSVCGHLGHKACGKSKPQKDKLFESSFVIPGVFFGVSVSETILERFCRFSNFKLWGNDLVVTSIKNLDPLFLGAIVFFRIASGLPG